MPILACLEVRPLQDEGVQVLRRRLADPVDEPLELGDAELGLVAQIGLKNEWDAPRITSLQFDPPTEGHVLYDNEAKSPKNGSISRVY